MMPDREKTIEGLEHCSDRSNMMCNRTCPYYDSIFCEAELAGDALAMLKEQEDEIAKFCGEVARLTAMLKEQEAIEPKSLGNNRFACGSCSNPLWVYHQRFCASCGRAVKWE